MINLSAPNQARIPIGTVIVNGKLLEVTINLEWARFFESLTLSTNGNAAAMGKSGVDGVTVFLPHDGSESMEFIPGPPGSAGRPGDQGLALFMLQDGENNGPDMVMVPQSGQPEAYIAPALLNSWVNFGGGFSTAGYYKDSVGVVHLTGMIMSGVLGAAAFTLPPGYCPQNKELIAAISNGSTGRLDVMTNGDVVPTSGFNTWFSLCGIAFRAA